jgi:hypothetical protein
MHIQVVGATFLRSPEEGAAARRVNACRKLETETAGAASDLTTSYPTPLRQKLDRADSADGDPNDSSKGS